MQLTHGNGAVLSPRREGLASRDVHDAPAEVRPDHVLLVALGGLDEEEPVDLDPRVLGPLAQELAGAPDLLDLLLVGNLVEQALLVPDDDHAVHVAAVHDALDALEDLLALPVVVGDERYDAAVGRAHVDVDLTDPEVLDDVAPRTVRDVPRIDTADHHGSLHRKSPSLLCRRIATTPNCRIKSAKSQ